MASLVDHAIASLDEAKTWIGISDTSQDSLVTDIINAVTDFIESERCLARRVKRRTAAIEEKFTGDGTNWYRVKHPPIGTLSEIYIEDIVTLDASDCADTDLVRYDPDNGDIWLVQYRFWKGYPLNCKVTYTGGWETVPNPIKQAALMLVKALYKYRDRQSEGVSSVSFGVAGSSQTISYLTDVVKDPNIWTLLEPYRLVRYR